MQVVKLQVVKLHEDSATPSGADAPVSSFEQEETKTTSSSFTSVTDEHA